MVHSKKGERAGAGREGGERERRKEGEEEVKEGEEEREKKRMNRKERDLLSLFSRASQFLICKI